MAEKKFDLRKLQEADVPKHYISAEEKETAKFGKLVFEFPQERNEIVAEGDPVDYIVKPQAYFRGASQIPGSEFNQSYQIFVKPFFLDRVQHRQCVFRVDPVGLVIVQRCRAACISGKQDQLLPFVCPVFVEVELRLHNQ